LRNFTDGLQSLFNELANRRSAPANNVFVSSRLDWAQLNEIYKTGLGNKIVRIKAGQALKSGLSFDRVDDEEVYHTHLAKAVKLASTWMLVFGRGIVVIHEPNADLSQPLTSVPELRSVKLDVFSGDMVSVNDVERDLSRNRYNMPIHYSVRGYPIHYSRVIDFTYVPVIEYDLPTYQYGGVSEFELIYNQLINDAIVERSSAHIVEKNSTLFYKIQGFKSLLQSRQEAPLLKYFQTIEDRRSLYGAGVLDGEDDVVNVQQAMTNLSEVDQITLRRLAMVTGIPLAILIGENVKGLNSTGENEMEVFWSMIAALRDDYLINPINALLVKLGLSPAKFTQASTLAPGEQIEFEAKAIQNALALWQMGEDYAEYLTQHGVIPRDSFAEMFSGQED